MNSLKFTYKYFTACFFLLLSFTAFADITLVKFGAIWKYLDIGSAAPTGSGAADWRNIAFNDAVWAGGPAELGYGDNDERTTINYGGNPANKFVTTYFRKNVTIADISLFASFNLKMYVDDGAVVYVNGIEVARTNMPAGSPAYSTFAAATAIEDGNNITSFNIPAANFVSGNNIIAVEVHQSSITSSDISFDLELTGKSASTVEPTITRGPFLQMVSENAISIKWQTDIAANARIVLGTTENSLTTFVDDNTVTTNHEIRITGLTPDTKYFYGVGTASSILNASYRNTFVTSPLVNTTRKIRIGVFGDAGRGDIFQKNVRNAYLNLNKNGGSPELVLMLGDNAYENGLDAEHQTKFFDIYDDNIFTNHVIFPVPGNHEYANNGTLAINHNIPYYDIFTVPTTAESGGTASGTKHYYSFNYGNIHFIMLDSYGYDGGSRLFDDTTNGQQAVWLKTDLAANAGLHKWTIVCLHHPPYTNGSHISGYSTDGETDLVAIRKNITPILERYGVDIVLSGHSHVYERSFLIQNHTGFGTTFNNAAPPIGNLTNGSSARYDGTANSCPYFTIDSMTNHGTVYVVAGSAGQIGGGINAQMPMFYYKNYSGGDNDGGAVYFEVQDNRIDAKFIGATGKLWDQFTIMKGVNKKTFIDATVNTPVILNASWVGSYNWYKTLPTVLSNNKSYSITPDAIGEYTYYVNDSLVPKTTCIADTFVVQVTSALALSISEFKAFPKNNHVILKWTTSQEVNSHYFTLERSANGRNFEMLTIINCAGNSSIPQLYEFEDQAPLQGNNYYRLIATDKNGDAKIVGIKLIKTAYKNQLTVLIKPNPALNNTLQLSIESNISQLINIMVTDMKGSAVYNTKLSVNAGSNNCKFVLPNGTFVLKTIAEDGSVLTKRFIVK